MHTPLTISPFGTPLNGPESFELLSIGESDRFRPLSTVALSPGSIMPERGPNDEISNAGAVSEKKWTVTEDHNDHSAFHFLSFPVAKNGTIYH